ncbi:MAG TPA: hypothetical protein VK985_02210 [Rariglobus sp.]|nr:hypothetical protein [Rariglobus sp.]
MAVVLAGVWFMNADSFVPSVAGKAAEAWPAETTLARNETGYTLVVALHPECPCSRATLEELGKIMARADGRLRTQVWCVQYAEIADKAEQSALWAQAKRIPGIDLRVDHEGREARRFDMRVSGETRLYGRSGELLFQGGITAARGHVGDNPGQETILNLITGHRTAGDMKITPVFGCSL